MIAKFVTRAGFVLVLAIGLTALWSTSRAAGEKQIDPGVTLRVESVGVENGAAPWQMGKNAVERAEGLVGIGMPLFPTAGRNAYTADYTGFVSYVWQLPRAPELSNANEWSHALRSQYVVEIPYEILEPGDILTNNRAGSYGEALVFARWVDPLLWDSVDDLTDRTYIREQFQRGVAFVGYRVDRFANPARVVEQTYTLQLVNGAMTITQLDSTLYGPYYALRHNRVPGYADLRGDIFIFSQVKVDVKTTAQFTLINRGGTSLSLEDISVVAYGPDAAHQGLDSTQMVFPQVKEIVLAPGHTYEYRQAFVFEQPGSYVALPRFQVNGVTQSPLRPAYFQVVSRR